MKGRIVIPITPSGNEGIFYDLCREAIENKAWRMKNLRWGAPTSIHKHFMTLITQPQPQKRNTMKFTITAVRNMAAQAQAQLSRPVQFSPSKGGGYELNTFVIVKPGSAQLKCNQICKGTLKELAAYICGMCGVVYPSGLDVSATEGNEQPTDPAADLLDDVADTDPNLTIPPDELEVP